MTIETLLRESAIKLKEAGLESPRFEAEVLLAAIMKESRAMLYAHGNDVLDEVRLQDFQQKLERRMKREPMAYILGEKDFMGLTFKVSPAVLIPRPDTETVVEAALERIPSDVEDFCVLDLCTGSGAIGLSIGTCRPQIDLTLTDLSEEALAIAGQNAKNFFPSARILQGDLFAPVKKEVFDLIVSNPPYIPKNIIETLESDVKDYEPHLALNGGESGFDIYDRIIAEARAHLKENGWLLLEAGDGQGEKLLQKLQSAGFQNTFMAYDLIHMPRCIGGQKY